MKFFKRNKRDFKNTNSITYSFLFLYLFIYSELYKQISLNTEITKEQIKILKIFNRLHVILTFFNDTIFLKIGFFGIYISAIIENNHITTYQYERKSWGKKPL